MPGPRGERTGPPPAATTRGEPLWSGAPREYASQCPSGLNCGLHAVPRATRRIWHEPRSTTSSSASGHAEARGEAAEADRDARAAGDRGARPGCALPLAAAIAAAIADAI